MRAAYPLSDPKLSQVVNRLVEAYRPECIYLFGSHARGEAGPDSDYDLVVIVPDSASPERCRSRIAYQALWGSGRCSRLYRIGLLRSAPSPRLPAIQCPI